MLTADLIDDPAGLEPWSEAWDRLAVELSQPCSSPKWMLPWWRHAVPGHAELRTVVVRDGDELVGLAPYFVQLGPLGLAEYRVLSAGAAHRIGPLAKPGREGEVAGLVAETTAAASPQPSSFIFEGINASSDWPQRIRGAWPGALGSRIYTQVTMEAPTLNLDDPDFDTWFGWASSNFRQQMRRKGRQMADRGGRSHGSHPEQASADLEAMFVYHRDRWEKRGEQGSIKHGTEDHLREAVSLLLPDERARLWTIEADGKPVCVPQYFTVAGGELTYWGGGFDPDCGDDLQPAQLTILAAVENAFERGDRRVDFGGGEQRLQGAVRNQRRPPDRLDHDLPPQQRYATRSRCAQPSPIEGPVTVFVLAGCLPSWAGAREGTDLNRVRRG